MYEYISMKNITILIILLLTCGLTKAQSNREDIEIDWPKADGWVLDKSLSVQTDFAHRHQKWDMKPEGKESWQKMVMILDDDITKTMMPLDSAYISPKLSNTEETIYNLLEEKKNGPFPYKLISLENRKIKSEQVPISTLIYITDGRTCRHIILISVKTQKFSADFLKQWSEILLHSRIIPSKAGNFESTDDAYLDKKETNGINTFYITANFKSNQIAHLIKGQPVKIIIDSFPELTVSGKVSEISSKKIEANGFALTSPNTASGNFVKMVERFPVTIKADLPAAVNTRLKNGMSCTVTVFTAPSL
jgi:hypothetical protein